MLFVPRSRTRLAGAAYTKFLFTIIYWGGDRDTVPRGELSSIRGLGAARLFLLAACKTLEQPFLFFRLAQAITAQEPPREQKTQL